MRTVITIERLHESGPGKRPITIRITRGNRSMVAFLDDAEACRVKTTISRAIAADGKHREAFEVEKDECMCNGDTVLVCRTCAESQK